MPYKPEGGGYSMFPRRGRGGEEEEEEEERIGPSTPIPRPGALRRPGEPRHYPQPRRYEGSRRFQEVTKAPESVIPELWEKGGMIPDVELDDPDFQYASMFENLPLPPPRYVQRPEPKGGPRPSPGPERRPPSEPSRREAARPEVDPGEWFDLDAVWNAVQELRQKKQFAKGKAFAILSITSPTKDVDKRREDLMRFFRISREEADQYGARIWEDLFHPFMKELSRAMNREKPKDIPGGVDFQETSDGSIWLAYFEN